MWRRYPKFPSSRSDVLFLSAPLTSITLITLLVDYLFTPQSRHVSDWEPSGEFEYLIACLHHLVFINANVVTKEIKQWISKYS